MTEARIINLILQGESIEEEILSLLPQERPARAGVYDAIDVGHNIGIQKARQNIKNYFEQGKHDERQGHNSSGREADHGKTDENFSNEA